MKLELEITTNYFSLVNKTYTKMDENALNKFNQSFLRVEVSLKL